MEYVFIIVGIIYLIYLIIKWIFTKPVLEYYANGQTKVSGKTVLKKRIGDFTFYNEDGTIEKVIKYENGISKKEYKLLKSINDPQPKSIDEAKEYVRIDVRQYLYFNSDIQKEIPLSLITQSKAFQNDREVVLEAVKRSGVALEFASDELRNDRELVLEAVKENGFALEYASKELKNDREVVLEAVKSTFGFSLKYASKELKNDRELVLEAVKENGYALESSKELENDRELVEALKQDGFPLKFALKKFKNDRELFLEALKQTLKFAPNKLKNDRELVLEADKRRFK